MITVTDNLDDVCFSLRDFLTLVAAARLARHPYDDLANRLLDMVVEVGADDAQPEVSDA